MYEILPEGWFLTEDEIETKDLFQVSRQGSFQGIKSLLGHYSGRYWYGRLGDGMAGVALNITAVVENLKSVCDPASAPLQKIDASPVLSDKIVAGRLGCLIYVSVEFHCASKKGARSQWR